MYLNDRRRCPFRIDSSQKIMSEKKGKFDFALNFNALA